MVLRGDASFDDGTSRRDVLALDFFIRPQYTASGRAIAIFCTLAYNLVRRRVRYNFKLWAGRNMPKYVIERDIPKIGNVTPEEVVAISQKSCSVLNNLGPKIQWLHSYVTQDKLYCVYIAPNKNMVREHAKQGGFPANRISEVKQIIDPTTPKASGYSPRPPSTTRTWPVMN